MTVDDRPVPAGRPSTPVRAAPQGSERLKWVGPGILWALAALATGELLFTPRVGAQYGYTLMWALVIALALKLFITREVGRYSVVTGKQLLTGYASLPGPRGWAVWAILVPQLVVGVAAIGGIASAAGSAVVLVAPGSVRLWTAVLVTIAVVLVVWGRYSGIEWISRVLGIALALGAVAAAVLVGPDLAEAAQGFVPTIPSDLVVADILPWLGFLSNGAAGLMWYSYWVAAKGAGMAGVDEDDRRAGGEISETGTDRLRRWLRTMSLDVTLAVVGTGIITVAFLVLGAELLRPAGVVPAEDDVARDLSTLFSDVFGQWGFWLISIGMISAFWTAVLTNIDGWRRLYTDGLRRLFSERMRTQRWAQPEVLGRIMAIVWLGILPVAVFFVFGDPVVLLTLAGSIEALHIPLVAALTLWLNRREVPPALRAGKAASAMVVLATVFFVAFAVFFLIQQFTGG